MTSIKCVRNATFLNYYETVDNALKSRKSILRFGDGEFILLSGKGIHYQDFSKELQSELNDIIETYINDPKSCEYILCMPADFLICNGLKLLKKREYISSWSYTRKLFKYKYDKPLVYGNSFLFAKGNEKIYKKLWNGVENVIFVHNDEQYSKKFRKKYNINTYSVIIPSKNAFERREQILQNILDKAQLIGKDNTVILISAGPCGKVLVKKLSELGYIAYDTGHCWDDPLKVF